MSYTLYPDFSVMPLPHVVRIEPSSLCNLRCVHCPTGARGAKGGIMSYRTFLKIIEELKSYKGVDVVVLYHGGEPFLNKDIFKMIGVVKSMGIPFVKTVTNGMLVDDELLSKIINSRLDSIEFSLDGLTPEENNRIRKGSDYFRVASRIKKLLCMKREAGASTPEIYISNAQIPEEADILTCKEASTPEFILEDFSDFLGEIKFKNTYIIKWAAAVRFNRYELVESPNCKCTESLNYCDKITETVTILWNGDVLPCCYDLTGNYVVGNINKSSLSDIWNCRKYRELRRRIHMRDYPSLCANCRVIKPSLFMVKKTEKVNAN